MRTFNIRKLILFLIVVLVAASTVAAVTAYTSATVTSPAETKIVATNQALLALSPGFNYGNDIVEVEVSADKGILQLNMSFDSQNEELYTYHSLFSITNNSANTIDISLFSDISYITEISPDKNTLSPGETANVKVVFSTTSNEGQGINEGIITVEANAVH